MEKTWIVVADASRARFFETIDDDTLRELEDLVNPAGRQQDRDLRTDNQGRYYGRGEQMQGHTAAPHTDPVTHELQLFAQRICRHLEHGRTEHRYERLCIIAAPKVLGLIRQHLDKTTRRLVTEELDKDISNLDERAVQEYFQRHFREQ